jgi:hypothetical protein
MVFAGSDRPRHERQLSRTQFRTPHLGATNLGEGGHRGQVLGLQAWHLATRADSLEVHGFPLHCRQGQDSAENLASTFTLIRIDVDHPTITSSFIPL